MTAGPDLLSQVEVCQRLGICDETWMRWRKAGRAPEAVTLPSGRLKWRVVDIDALAGLAPERQSRYFQSAQRHADKVNAKLKLVNGTSVAVTRGDR